ncbi:hypothetical protein EV190_102326 [Actinorugispora endophytica]|uniref:Uncharacterized protein n=1 Tax=Actinorugispora endophytica TaxID=1605990 RepID=A0A4R6V3E0_9ACTN|nr:hypothetical protein EV190_102326 [Actinorugispora endophytica]
MGRLDDRTAFTRLPTESGFAPVGLGAPREGGALIPSGGPPSRTASAPCSQG